MAEQPVIIYKDNKHTPATAGDTIPASAIPISAEQGNTLQAKDDGLFSAAGGGGNAATVALTRRSNGLYDAGGKDFSQYAVEYEYTFTNSEGQETKFKEAMSRPMFFELPVNGSSVTSLDSLYLTPWVYRVEDGAAALLPYIELPVTMLDTPELQGTTLNIKLKHRMSTGDVPHSVQTVSVDLASLAGGPAFTEAPQGPANTTSGDDVPTDFIGRARNNLLAEPDKWLYVEIDGQRGAVPWFSI